MGGFFRALILLSDNFSKNSKATTCRDLLLWRAAVFSGLGWSIDELDLGKKRKTSLMVLGVTCVLFVREVAMNSEAVVEKIEASRLYRSAEVAELFALSDVTLRKWRMNRKSGEVVGPRYVQLGGRNVRYQGSDLINWYRSCVQPVT